MGHLPGGKRGAGMKPVAERAGDPGCGGGLGHGICPMRNGNKSSKKSLKTVWTASYVADSRESGKELGEEPVANQRKTGGLCLLADKNEGFAGNGASFSERPFFRESE